MRRPVRQPRQAPRRVAAQPPMNRLTRHPIPRRHLGDRHALAQDLQHRRMPLLHQTQLHQHDDPLPCDDPAATSEEGSAPPTADHPRVTQEPEPLSPSNRNPSENRHTPTGANPSSITRNNTASVEDLAEIRPPTSKPQTRATLWPGISQWRGEDLNLRPSGYEPDELPDCSTPRRISEDTPPGVGGQPATCAAPLGRVGGCSAGRWGRGDSRECGNQMSLAIVRHQ